MAAGLPDARVLADLVAGAQSDVQALREGIGNFGGELDKAPSFIRSMVEKELSQSTGLAITEWGALMTDLAGRLATLRRAAERLGDGQSSSSIEAVYPGEFPALVDDLSALARFLDKIPSRMSLVPPLLLGPRERADLLANIADQSARLEALSVTLPRLAQEAGRLALP